MMWKKPKLLDTEIIKYLGLVGRLGFTVVITLLLFILLFLYLDKKLHTGGILIPVGAVLGVVAGVVAAYRQIKKFYNEK